MFKKILLLFLLISLTAISLLILPKLIKSQIKYKNAQYPGPLPVVNISPLPVISINSLKIPVLIADTPEKQRQGLSNTSFLPEDHGMLFIYKEKVSPYFWMIQMKYPIDIIWIADNEVVDISFEVPNPNSDTPPSELPKYHPPRPVNYVLEVNAGFAKRHDIKVGDPVEIKP